MPTIAYAGVHLLDEVDRIGGQGGLASVSTTYFRETAGYTIELDTATGLVTVAHTNGAAIVVPRERVKRFEPKKPAPQK